MAGVFFIAFIIAEVLLVVLTFTKFGEKSAWLKNRAIIRAVETLLILGIVLVPATHMKWRFIIALFIIVFRFITAGLSWLIRRKKISGNKKKAWSVVNCVLSVILVGVSLTPAFIFTNYNGLPTTGKYSVNEVSAILVDSKRNDPFESDGSKREVPAHFYYPEGGDGSYPLVVFSHGAFGYYQSNYSTYAELASNGYVVAALDHPHHSIFTKDIDGKTIIVDKGFMDDVMKINETTDDEEVFNMSRSWVGLRIDDENFVLDTIKNAKNTKTLDTSWHTDDKDAILEVLSHTDTEKIGLIGHSLGGASGVTVAGQRSDIDAVVDLDGTMLGEIREVQDGKNVYDSEPYPVPILDFTKKKDYNDREEYKNKNGYPYVNEYVVQNAKDGKTVSFAGVEHMDFTDLPLISPFIAEKLGSSDVDHEKIMNEINGIVLNWFDYYLKNEGKLEIKAEY